MHSSNRYVAINFIAVFALWFYLFFSGPFRELLTDTQGETIFVVFMLFLFAIASIFSTLHEDLSLFMMGISALAILTGLFAMAIFNEAPVLANWATIMFSVGIANLLALIASFLLVVIYAIAMMILEVFGGLLGLSES